MINYQDKFKLNDKVAIVVGGCGLLGSEVSIALLSAGANVYVLDVNEKQGNNLVELSKKYKASLVFVKFDCSDIKNLEIHFLEVMNHIPSIDIFVNCSYPRTEDWSHGSFSDISFECFRKNVDIHMNSYAWLSRLVAERMVQNRSSGSIIQFGSIYGVVGQDLSVYEGTDMKENMAYAAIKGGITNLTKLMASYYGQWNIRINTICPGGISGHVAGGGDVQNRVFVKNYSKKVPLGRMGQSEEVAAAVLYLASEASSYTTGSNLVVDGGWTSI